MANCVTCGKWAGFNRTIHDNCEAPAPPPPQSPTQLANDDLVAKLRPVLLEAAAKAGRSAAFNFFGICVVTAVLYAVVWFVANYMVMPSGPPR